MRRLLLGTATALTLGLSATAAEAASADPIPEQDWSFDGIFGTFDRAAAQRGFKVFEEACASCHGLDLIAYRNLTEIGFSEAEVDAIAAQYEVEDGPDDDGEMYMREAEANDRFANPYPNEEAARAANMGAYPPDLSLITKARGGGADYLYALLVGYEDPPEDFELAEGLHYNRYFSGRQIAMGQPLYEDSVSYDDGTEATIEQMAHDVTVFLSWAAEPEMEERKQMGVKVILFLMVFTALLYAVKKKIWSDLK